MKIKKLDETVSYMKKNTRFELEVNGKKVDVNEYVSDDEFGSYDCEVEVDEQDREALTDEEAEALDDYIGDVLKLENGEELTVD